MNLIEIGESDILIDINKYCQRYKDALIIMKIQIQNISKISFKIFVNVY